MSEASKLIVAPRTPEERLALANRLYQEYYGRCFWHCPRDLVITEDLLPLVVNGLRKHGGRRGFILAAELQPNETAGPTPERQLPMPLTAFQRKVARVLAAHRNPESHVAGGTVINRSDNSFRYSTDLDIFHDVAASVAQSAEADVKSLEGEGHVVEWTLRQEGFFRAEVSRGDDRLRLDWSTDSAFRFFPVQPDETFGYCLHPADLAINKLLALAGRTEFRDFLDTLYLDGNYLGLGATVWAACGKDPGYTPPLLLDMANRHTRFQESDLKGELLARPVDFKELKKQWLEARERAERLVMRLPVEDLGCLYLNADNEPVTPEPENPGFVELKRHFGSVRGAWPRIS